VTLSPKEAGQVRVGTAERQAAMDLLGVHWRAGRLTPGEHEARTTKAFAAVTRADLDALFLDLPVMPSMPGPEGPTGLQDSGLPPGQPAPTWTSTTPVARAPGMPAGASTPARGLRDTIMALTPFAAIGLFFTGHAPWPVFLAIPVMGILLYGPGGKPDSEAQTRQRAARDARRAERDQSRADRHRTTE
jgi:hypothetical protein